MLGPGNRQAAIAALKAYPGQVQVGSGINETNCQEWIDHGAPHVIFHRLVFSKGKIDSERLKLN